MGYRYGWLNWDLDTIDIGPAPFKWLKLIAHLFQRLMFVADFSCGGSWHFDFHNIQLFRDVKDIHVRCTEPSGPCGW